MNTVEPIRDLRQIDAMKKILKAGNIRDWLLFTLGINSTLRVSDLLKLRQVDTLDDRGRPLDYIRIREKKTAPRYSGWVPANRYPMKEDL